MNYPSIRIEGAILSGDILDAIETGDKSYQKAKDFGLDPTTKVKDEIAEAWAAARAFWTAYQLKVDRLRENASGTTETRNQWIVPLLGLLGYQLDLAAKGEVHHGKNYAISHRDKSRDGFPVHVMGWRDSLDKKRTDSGPRMSPHALVQEYLNLTEHLYAIVTNGRQLRLLRDSSRLIKLSFIEFDLDQMFREELFSDFAIFYRLLHASRMPVTHETAVESIIELYHQDAQDSGSRIREGLSKAVENSIKSLANGFLSHPANEILIQSIRSGETTEKAFYQWHLRFIYRLLFLLVIEGRRLVFPKDTNESHRDIYYRYYSVTRLRDLSERRYFADRNYHDAWRALRATFRLFDEQGDGEKLNVAPLAGDLFDHLAIGLLNDCELDNEVLLQCLQNLSRHPETRNRVNYAALNVEEFGSVYEGLLEYDAKLIDGGNSIEFRMVEGDSRAASGSHYTPDELVQPLIKHSLDHLIADRLKKPDPEKALLSLTVCDVACGSGHILLNAARRIGMELAILRTGEDQPSPPAMREAVRDAIRHCIYGMDLNPLAVELCKVALWLEAHVPGQPLNFLDHRIKCGNAIVGLAHRDELKRGIPNEAFKTLKGDDMDLAAELRKRNKEERKGQTQLNFEGRVEDDITALKNSYRVFERTPERGAADYKERRKRYDEFRNNLRLRNLRLLADAQVAQFFLPKTSDNRGKHITHDTYSRWVEGVNPTGPAIGAAESIARRKRFGHWFIEFWDVMESGGFDCILGNPPYLGDKKLKSKFGDAFVSYVHCRYAPGSGCDLIAYFVRRIGELLSERGFQALIATNSIAQGKTRICGLHHVFRGKETAVYAETSRPWPGEAAVVVTLLSIHKGDWTKPCQLGMRTVDRIDSYLQEDESIGEPHPLARNEKKSFIGNYVLGDGFIMSEEEATGLIKVANKNRHVVFPYLIGEDLNTNHRQEPSRWVINFAEMPIKKVDVESWINASKKVQRSFLSDGLAPPSYDGPLAPDYDMVFEILEQRVRNQRRNCGDQRSRIRWWLHARSRPELYATIASYDRVMVHARVTKTHAFEFVCNNQVYSDQVVVFAFEDFSRFLILQSTLHEVWAWRYASTLKTDRRYSPTQCFDCFPLAEDNVGALCTLGESYHQHRFNLMQLLRLGLTKTYNLFHLRELNVEAVAKASKQSPEVSARAYQDLLTLRNLHRQMDEIVLKAYGWQQESSEWGAAIALRHDFYEVDYHPESDRVRFTIHPDARKEILKRLLKLNHQRYAEEVAAGLHEKKKPRPAKKSAKVKKKSAKSKTASNVPLPELASTFRYEMPEGVRHAAPSPAVYHFNLIHACVEKAHGALRVDDLIRSLTALSDPAQAAQVLPDDHGLTGMGWRSSLADKVDPALAFSAMKDHIERNTIRLVKMGDDFVLQLQKTAPPMELGHVLLDAEIALNAASSQPELTPLPELAVEFASDNIVPLIFKAA